MPTQKRTQQGAFLLEAPPLYRPVLCRCKRPNLRTKCEIPGKLCLSIAIFSKVCYNKLRKAVNIVSQLRRLRQQIHNQHNLKIKRQKTVFSTCFIITLIISLIMLVICAINKAPTFTTTVISGCAWLIFDFLFAYAIKNKWAFLFDECSTGRVSSDYHKTDMQRRKDNWQGNCFKFAISIAVLAIHVILFFIF